MTVKNFTRKLLIFNTLLGIVLLIASIFLYSKLPEIIPNKIGFLGNTTIYGNKSNIYILPITLLIFSFLFSRKWVENWKSLLSTSKIVQILLYLIILLVWLYSIILYVKYFKMI